MLKFLKMREEHLERVLNWRIRPEIKTHMLSDVKNDLIKQKQWFQKISSSNSCKYWIISYDSTLLGVINLAGIDYNHKHCTWGYYIGETDYRGLGGIIPPYLYNYIFLKMKFKKIFGEVIKGNEEIMRLHNLHGYRYVGVYKDHIIKNNKFHDVLLVELLDEAWFNLQKKYKRYIADFEE